MQTSIWLGSSYGLLKIQKLGLTSIIDNHEALAEVRPLTAQVIGRKSQLNADVPRLLHEEELKWYQQSKA
jgi:hypothetical protein